MSDNKFSVLPAIGETNISLDDGGNLLIEQDDDGHATTVFVPREYINIFIDLLCDVASIGLATKRTAE